MGAGNIPANPVISAASRRIGTSVGLIGPQRSRIFHDWQSWENMSAGGRPMPAAPHILFDVKIFCSYGFVIMRAINILLICLSSAVVSAQTTVTYTSTITAAGGSLANAGLVGATVVISYDISPASFNAESWQYWGSGGMWFANPESLFTDIRASINGVSLSGQFNPAALSADSYIYFDDLGSKLRFEVDALAVAGQNLGLYFSELAVTRFLPKQNFSPFFLPAFTSTPGDSLANHVGTYYKEGTFPPGGGIAFADGSTLSLDSTQLVISVQGPIPEPSTYGLVLGGLALAGAAIRRRRSAK